MIERYRGQVVIVPVMAKGRTRSGAKTRKIGTLAEVAAASLLPVDPELFLWCQGVYYAVRHAARRNSSESANSPAIRRGTRQWVNASV